MFDKLCCVLASDGKLSIFKSRGVCGVRTFKKNENENQKHFISNFKNKIGKKFIKKRAIYSCTYNHTRPVRCALVAWAWCARGGGWRPPRPPPRRAAIAPPTAEPANGRDAAHGRSTGALVARAVAGRRCLADTDTWRRKSHASLIPSCAHMCHVWPSPRDGVP